MTNEPVESPAQGCLTLRWIGGIEGCLRMIDQTLLPGQLLEFDCLDAETVWEAIRTLRVRGAPAIGIAAAYGVCLGLQTVAGADEATFFRRLDEVIHHLAQSRPTAVNLFWALERLGDKARTLRGSNSPDAIARNRTSAAGASVIPLFVFRRFCSSSSMMRTMSS